MQYHHFVVVFGSDGIDDDSSKVLEVALSKSSNPDFQTCTWLTNNLPGSLE